MGVALSPHLLGRKGTRSRGGATSSVLSTVQPLACDSQWRPGPSWWLTVVPSAQGEAAQCWPMPSMCAQCREEVAMPRPGLLSTEMG